MRTPQWSPVMKTGNTAAGRLRDLLVQGASMEPGHEDREYPQRLLEVRRARRASMEPGHEDREYLTLAAVPWDATYRLNGARS